jgi:Legionella pneumophila major outer membrane protein precursor
MNGHTRALMMGGVSLVALSVCGPAVLAADMPTKAPLVTRAVPVSPWTFWVEGGAQAVSGGDSAIGGLFPTFTPGKQTWGWNGAAALDYRFNTMWHVSADFRYGANKTRTTTSNPLALISTTVATPTLVGTNSADRKETNWVADFMVGRDIGLGAGTSQIKAGLRVAHIKATTDGTARWTNAATTTIPSVVVANYSQTSKWTGWGPRVALEGNAPLTGPWSVDYMVGVAALFGHQNIDQTATQTLTGPFPPVCLAGCPGVGTSSSNNTVFNADGMLGLAYAIAPNNKVALNYRVDYYSNAVRVIDSAGNASNTNRTYHGPNLRWTVNF